MQPKYVPNFWLSILPLSTIIIFLPKNKHLCKQQILNPRLLLKADSSLPLSHYLFVLYFFSLNHMSRVRHACTRIKHAYASRVLQCAVKYNKTVLHEPIYLNFKKTWVVSFERERERGVERSQALFG